MTDEEVDAAMRDGMRELERRGDPMTNSTDVSCRLDEPFGQIGADRKPLDIRFDAHGLPIPPEPGSPAQTIVELRRHVVEYAKQIKELHEVRDDLLKAARDLEAFVGVMCGRGPDAVIPETIRGPLGVKVKIGEIMRYARAAIAKATQP